MSLGYNPGSSIVAKLIPSGSVGVEIGVYEGGTSEKFLQVAGHVHLVDPWVGRDDQFHRVKDRVSGKAATIHRMTSARFFETFGKKVDWVYIDGLHDYESVKVDLYGVLTILKPGGMIYGDDYGKKVGVKEAVDEFCSVTGRKLILLGLSQYAIP